MAKASSYWLKRLEADRALAQRSADEVAEEMKREYRLHYAQVAKRLDSLYVEAQSRGELSRTKLWNYLSYRDVEKKLSDMVEGGSMIQRDKITKTLNRVFEQTIGASADAFRREKYVLPYDPRSVVDTAWSGDHFSNRLWKNNSRLAEEVRAGCRGIVMGLESPSTIKQRLMRDFDATWSQAERLVDTETSYVFNKANLMNYERRGRQKLTIVCLDVNTCEKCKALEGEVFLTEEAAVLPIHPRCHCAYCVPRELDEAEVTMHGGDLEEVYARKGVKGYGDGADGAEASKEYIPKNLQERIDRAANPVIDIAAPVEGAAAEMPELAGAQMSAKMPAQTEEMPAQTEEMPESGKTLPIAAVEDITERFIAEGSPGKGNVIIPQGYKTGKHADEIAAANVLVRDVGGDIELIDENNKNHESSADYMWREKLWELKSPQSLNGLDKLVHKGMRQIAKNPGGLVIQLPENASLDEAEGIVKHRVERSKAYRLVTVTLRSGTVMKVVQYIKK